MRGDPPPAPRAGDAAFEPPDPPSGDPARGRWWAGRRTLLPAAVAAAVLLPAAVVVLGALDGAPDRPVRELFAALADRDAERAGRLVGCAAPSCRDPALREGYEPPTDLRTGRVGYGDPRDDTRRPDRSRAYLPITYRIGGTELSSTVWLTRDRVGSSRPWRISDGGMAMVLLVTPAADRVRLGGVTVTAAPVAGAQAAVPVFPGRYAVAIPADDPLVTAAPGDAVIAGRPGALDPVAVPVAVTVKPEAVAAIRIQVAAYLAACARSTELSPRDCPFHVPGIILYERDVHWRVLDQPGIEVKPVDEPRWDGRRATVETVRPGRLEVRYTSMVSPNEFATTVEHPEVSVGGTVTVSPDGALTWSY
ncbi:hypothetical protein ACFFWC_13565 [Plantactinospora siamensis]|uniref:Uncharacterized protein n=1 Tax=Plantactinospora siamensis TaxID=555372 RepID=A0ABV6P2C4_9ACTN